MDPPVTDSGNRHVVAFQDFITKWPLVFPVPDQKAVRLVKLLTEEVIPLFGVPEALLSDRGTNLMSTSMLDICKKLGIRKLNTTAYHPECDGMVERFNRTLKTALRKHAATFRSQWDHYLSGVLFAYRNVPHDSTGEKPSYLLFGTNCRTPNDVTLLKPPPYSQEMYRITRMNCPFHFVQHERLQQRLYRKLSNITRLHMTASSNLSIIMLVTGSWKSSPRRKQCNSESFPDNGMVPTESLLSMDQILVFPRYTIHKMEEFKFTNLPLNLAHSIFLQASSGTVGREEDLVALLSGLNKF